MLVERVSNFADPPHSDCCAYYRTEILVLEAGKVMKIGRSMLFDTQLSEAGKRTDIPN